jgi:23S rRNA (guanine2445-N2)-methyltransferase / 23S rRNA (guanine2069-N7)-methyltransferase
VVPSFGISRRLYKIKTGRTVSRIFPIHVRTITGLEEVLAEELSALGAQDIELKRRMVLCRGDLTLLYRANLWCRTAIRVLRPLATFSAPDEKAFYKGVREIDWSHWGTAQGTLAVDADVYSSFTTHSLFVAQFTKDAVVDQFRDKTGHRPSVDLEKPDLRIRVGLFENTAQIYVDASGESLHKRGYRRNAGVAPLSETLAAGILKLSGWNGKTPLLDPMCGSGTLGIEAGLIVKNIAPGLSRRRFGFQGWSDYDRGLYERLVDQAKQAVRPHVSASITGIEIDPLAVQNARENVERAGLRGLVHIEQGDFFARTPALDRVGTLVMNPPYDERLSVENIADFFRRIGDQLKRNYGGWTAFVLSGNLEAIKTLGLRSSRRIIVFNGPLECRLLEYKLRAATPLERPPQRELPPPEKTSGWEQEAAVFANRLNKNLKHYGRWARREGVTCWRVYDRDIPDFPFIVDLYGDRVHFSEVPRNYEHSLADHPKYLEQMRKAAAETLQRTPDNVYLRQTKGPGTEDFFEVSEKGHRFLINLTDDLGPGLLIEQRKIRALIEREAAGKDFLCLFAHTGAFSVYAAAGGAKSTTTVDFDAAYLTWAEKNLHLNGFSEPSHQIVRSDALTFLEKTNRSFDLCVVVPPSRWIEPISGKTFDLSASHAVLLNSVLNRMRLGGKVFFCTSQSTWVLDERELKKNRSLAIEEMTTEMTPPDFERRPSQRCWRIEIPLEFDHSGRR